MQAPLTMPSQLSEDQSAGHHSSHPIRAITVKWLGTRQVAQRLGESERVIRYRLEAGLLPGVKHEGVWHIPPAVVGDASSSVFESEGVRYQVVSVGPVPEEEISVKVCFPGMAYSDFQPAKGSRGQLFASTHSGEVRLIAKDGCSGPFGYLWVTNPRPW